MYLIFFNMFFKHLTGYRLLLVLHSKIGPDLSAATFFQVHYMGLLEYLEKFGSFIDRWPGKERFGPYRFLPLFFFSGAGIEFCMIHWRPNGINFYDTYKTKKSHEKALKKLEKWKEVEALLK